MIADRKDTLDLLQRDASGLQRALQDAGLKTADNGLQFSLRDQSRRPAADNSNAQSNERPAYRAKTTARRPSTPRPHGYGRLARLSGGLDIRV